MWMSKHHTGTEPFMAIDLLRPDSTVHRYRHDLESLFYVLIWMTSPFHDGKDIVDHPLQDWVDDGKTTYVNTLPQPTTKFESLGRCILAVLGMFRDGFLTCSKYHSALSLGQQTSPAHFDEDTLGGLVTFDRFQTILDTSLP